MSNKALTILAVIVAGMVIIVGMIWYLRSRDTEVPVYNPFQTTVQTSQETEYDPPSNFSSEYDRVVPATSETDPSLVEPISLPSGLLQ